MFDPTLPIRGFQFLFAIISLGLNGYVAHWYNNATEDYGSISEVNFLIFCAIWTIPIVVLLTLGPLKFPSAVPLIATLVLDALTMLFWFAGFIALAAFHHNLTFCFGRVCDDLIAAIVFGAFEWLLFLSTTVFAALAFFRGSSKTTTAPPSTV